MKPRIVVTGVGVVSSAGADRREFLDMVAKGHSCLTAVNDPRLRSSLRVMAGLVSSLPQVPMLPPDWPALGRFAGLALSAADQAIRQAGLNPASMGRRMGAVLGTCSGPTTLIEEFYQTALDGRADRSDRQAFRLEYGSAVRAVARAFGIGGFTGTVTTACSAGLTAIGMGADLIGAGLCEAVLAGGADGYSISTQIGFDGLKAPSDGPCAPFSKPTGLSLGEGAAFLILERYDCVQQRGGVFLAEVLGFGTSNDAYHCSSPDPSGAGQSLAVVRALEDAGIDRERVSYVNAHGTGTPANDKAETKTIRRVFGTGAARLAVSSLKGGFGHTLGASGALEAAATILCQEAGLLPPTANFKEAREGCDLDYVPTPGRAWPTDPRGRVWIKESFAFGGHDASLVLRGAKSGGASSPAAAQPGMNGAFDRAGDSCGEARARVCIAGIGLVTPAGAGRDAFRHLLDRTEPVLRECSPAGHAPFRAALVPDELDPVLARRFGLRRMDKAGALGTVAACMAMTDAGVALRPDVAAGVGLYLGHASASNSAEASFVPDLLRNGYALQSVAEFPFVVPNATAGTMCRALGMKGHNATFCFGGGAGLMSLLAGTVAIQNRHAAMILAGSVDVLTEMGWGVPIPGRDGDVPAEGAVLFLLEDEEHLRQRGGRSLGYIGGLAVATNADGGWAEQPVDSMVLCTAQEALRHAGLDASALGAVCGPAAALLGRAPQSVTARMGVAEGCGPLFDMAAGLLGSDGSREAGEKGHGKEFHLLGSLSSRQGLTASVVVTAIRF